MCILYSQHISTRILYFQHLKGNVVLPQNKVVFNQKKIYIASAIKWKLTEMKYNQTFSSLAAPATLD